MTRRPPKPKPHKRARGRQVKVKAWAVFDELKGDLDWQSIEDYPVLLTLYHADAGFLARAFRAANSNHRASPVTLSYRLPAGRKAKV